MGGKQGLELTGRYEKHAAKQQLAGRFQAQWIAVVGVGDPNTGQN